MAKSESQRKTDLRALRKQLARRRRPLLSLDELSIAYGLTKPAFVNLRKTVDGFPDPADKRGHAYFYPALAAIDALLGYLERKEKATMGHAVAFSDLVRAPQLNGHDRLEPLTASEQLKAFDLRTKLIEEEVSQGRLHRADHCAAVADRVFTYISRLFGSGLADSVDPNGRWPAELRAAVDQAGQNVTLRAFEELKDMLTAGIGAAPDVDRTPARPARPSGPRNRPRQKGKARKGRGRMARVD